MNLYDLDTPALIVDYTILERNIARMTDVVTTAGKVLRPHTKTHKCIEIASMQVKAGAGGITVAKLGEAEVFAAAGFTDIFIANLVVGEQKLQRLVRLAHDCALTIGVDSAAVLEPIGEGADRAGVEIGILIEVDTGHGRAGVRDPEQAAVLSSIAHRYHRLRLRGVYTHQGHAYRASAPTLTALCEDVIRRLVACRDAIELHGDHPLEVVSVGSTPAAETMARMPTVTEMRPGNYVFYDATQVRLGAPPDRCALSVLASVVATPSPTEALLDAGSKSLSGDRDPVHGYGYVHGDPFARVDWCSEEHGHLHLGLSHLRPKVGQKLRIVPAHACTCVNMYPWLWVVEGESVRERWPTAARDRLQ